MERTLLSVEPALGGWSVRLQGLILDQKSTKFAAIDAAAAQASLQHETTGHPTGVSVVMNGGESVLVSLYG